MAHPNKLDAERAALVVVDIQEGFRNAIPDFAVLASRVSVAVRGCQILGVPVVITEQYPKGLGRTAEEIQLVLEDGTYDPVDKNAFSSCGASGFIERLTSLGSEQVILCGLEAHICVNQTAHDLVSRGMQVHLLHDCVSSRFEYNRLAALAKMQRAGVIESSIEMALFEMLGDAGHEKFKAIQELIK